MSAAPRQIDAFGPAAPLTILCIGSTDRSEFRQVRPALKPWGKVVAAPDVARAVALLADLAILPDLIIVAQSYPDEFSESKIEPLRRIAPLARLIALLGSWCEGETRTGRPWSAAVRIFWHQWEPHCHREFSRLLAGNDSIWSLPPTACEEERYLVLAHRPETGGAGRVEIVTRQYDVFDYLAGGCRRWGYTPHWLRPHDESPEDPPAAILLDAAGESEAELAVLRRLRSCCGAPVVVLADFPRGGDRDRFLRAGARAVLSRPFFWEDLFWIFQPAASSP